MTSLITLKRVNTGSPAKYAGQAPDRLPYATLRPFGVQVGGFAIGAVRGG